MIVRGVAHVPGHAEGVSLILEEPLSLWGGVDPTTGEIIDRAHPQAGESIAGAVLMMPYGRGSSGGSGVLAECLRNGTGPAAVIMRDLDPILLVGAMVAAELYPEVPCPVLEAQDGYSFLLGGMPTTVHSDGRIEQPIAD